MPDIDLIVVNYFSAELTRDAIASARAATSASLHVVVVDNSCDDDERRRLEQAGADEILQAPDNLGYAAGANLGISSTSARTVIVANPDVVFGEDCLDLLARQLAPDVAVAGPAVHWDERGRWLLPPADRLDAREKLSQAFASRFASFAGRRARSRLKRRVDFWRRTRPARIEAVSGAVMALRRDLLEAVGGFDTRYPLYFEEIDLIRHLQSKGGSTVYVPAARSRHLYNQSAGSHPDSESKFHRSEQLYLDRWAPLTGSLAKKISRPVAVDEGGFDSLEPSDVIPLPASDHDWLVEASPLASFDSAAGCFTADAERFPEEIWRTYRSPSLYLRVVHPSTLEIVSEYVIRKSPAD